MRKAEEIIASKSGKAKHRNITSPQGYEPAGLLRCFWILSYIDVNKYVAYFLNILIIFFVGVGVVLITVGPI